MKGAPSNRQRLLEGRMTALEGEISELRDAIAGVTAHIEYLESRIERVTDALDFDAVPNAALDDNRRGDGAQLGTERGSEASSEPL